MTQFEYHNVEFDSDSTDDFAYGSLQGEALQPAQIAIFSDRCGTRKQIAEDMGDAGFRAINGGAVSDLLCALENSGGTLGSAAVLNAEVIMVDCPQVEGSHLAALAQLDLRAASGTRKLIITTSLDALEDVFAVLEQSEPQILVQASRADRIVALGRVLADISNPRVREMTQEDRLNLLNLSRQVEAIAHKLEGLSGGSHNASTPQSALRAHSKPSLANGKEAAGQAIPSSRVNSFPPPLPDPKRVRQIIAARQARAKFFESDLFADPAWDMLLDLTAAHVEHARVSVTSLCIAAAVPATTALRWIKQLVECGVFVRIADATDRRRAFVGLSEETAAAMARYFAEVDGALDLAA